MITANTKRDVLKEQLDRLNNKGRRRRNEEVSETSKAIKILTTQANSEPPAKRRKKLSPSKASTLIDVNGNLVSDKKRRKQKTAEILERLKVEQKKKERNYTSHNLRVINAIFEGPNEEQAQATMFQHMTTLVPYQSAQSLKRKKSRKKKLLARKAALKNKNK